MNDFILAIFLGVIEGATEFIPVSSTGHLIVFGSALGFTGQRASTFEVFIQLGAILAVVWLYWERFMQLLDFSSNPSHALIGLTGLKKLILATVPALIAGFLLHGIIKEHLFSPHVVGFSLIGGGIILCMFPGSKQARTQSVDELSYAQCLCIGLFQILSLCPGVSRSGATIVGGMVLGCSRSVAAEFSFLLAVPTMCAAVGYDLLKSVDFLTMSDVPLFLTGFVVSFVVAVLAIKSFISFLGRATLLPFGVYRIVFGLLVLLYFGGL